MADAPSMTNDHIISVQIAAADLLYAHRLCSEIPADERTPFENDIAQMGRKRLERIAGEPNDR